MGIIGTVGRNYPSPAPRERGLSAASRGGGEGGGGGAAGDPPTHPALSRRVPPLPRRGRGILSRCFRALAAPARRPGGGGAGGDGDVRGGGGEGRVGAD